MQVSNFEDLPLMLKPNELQPVLKLSRMGIYNLVHQAGFPAIRFGRVIRIPRDALKKWLDEQAAGTGES